MIDEDIEPDLDTDATDESEPEPELERDPPPGKRIYVRSDGTGQLGWLVRRGGEIMVKYDRPNQDIVVKHSAAWVQIVDHRPCSHAQIVQVAFEADKMLLKLLGMHDKARKEFRDLAEKQLVAWLEEGPKNPPIRSILYRTILDVLSEHMVEH